MDLLRINAGSRYIKGKELLIYGSCVKQEHPKVFEKFSENKTALSLCLEKEHINMAVYKIASMLKLYNPPKEITVLTVDGSPHCIQLHYAIDEAKKLTSSDIKVEHFVITDRKAIQVSSEAVKLSRYLGKLEKRIKG